MRFSFHNHTNFSFDCSTTLQQMEQRCVKEGIDIIAITDHHTTKGAVKAAAECKKVRIVIGQEIETDKGEVIGLFLTEEIQRGLPLATVLQQVHKQGGIVVVPHPFDRLRKHVLSHEALVKNLDDIDVIEVFNARNIFSADNTKAAEFARQYDKLTIAGNDAHTVSELGKVVIELPDFHTSEEFLRALSSAVFTTKKSPLWVHGMTKVVKWRSRVRGQKS
jgi:predicted metal-dependent phosphoesterase TrpH